MDLNVASSADSKGWKGGAGGSGHGGGGSGDWEEGAEGRTNESGLNDLSKRLFRREKARLVADLETTKDKERHKSRRENGKVRNLKKPRDLEIDEEAAMVRAHDNEVRRVWKILSAQHCATEAACEAEVDALLRSALPMAASGTGAGGELIVSEGDLRGGDSREGRRSFGSGAANATLLAGLLPQAQPLLWWPSCAIVGNSGVLKGKTFGSEINVRPPPQAALVGRGRGRPRQRAQTLPLNP